jgi:hypothetical protein
VELGEPGKVALQPIAATPPATHRIEIVRAKRTFMMTDLHLSGETGLEPPVLAQALRIRQRRIRQPP